MQQHSAMVAQCNCNAGSAIVEVIDAEADQGNPATRRALSHATFLLRSVKFVA